jgi:two-component system nitrate/nitrite response regulator NarL
MSRIRLVVAEGRTLFRQGLVALLSTEADFVVVGEAANAEEAHRTCLHVLPDLILLDATLPGGDCAERLDIVTRLRACCPLAAIVVLGEAEPLEAEDSAGAMTAQIERHRAHYLGAAAYLHAGLDHGELVRALRTVAAARPGTDVNSDSTIAEGLHQPRSAGTEYSSEPGSISSKSSLTERESAILVLIAQGLCNKEIAYRLGISTQTVKNHVSHLLEKLALADRTQLAVYTLEQGVGRSS